MTTKDYELIARAIRQCEVTGYMINKYQLIKHLEVALEKDNKNFNRLRFSNACHDR